MSSFVSSFYGEIELNKLIPLMGINLFFISLGRQYSLIAQKELYFQFISLTEILTNIVSLIPAVVLAYYGFGVYSLVVSTLFASFLSNFMFFFVIKKQHKVSFHFLISEIKPFLKIGIYQTGGQIANYFSTQLDVMIIGKVLGTEALGVYNLAKNLAMRPAQVINPIVTKISAPVLSKIQNDPNLLKRWYLQIIKSLSFVNFPIYFFMTISSMSIIKIIYDIDSREMSFILSILSVYYMLRSIGNPLGGLVIATGRTDLEFYWNIGMLIIFPVFVYIGSKHSLSGTSIALLLMTILTYLPAWKFLYKKIIGISLREYTMQFIPYLLFSIVPSVITYFILKQLGFIYILNVIIGFFLFTSIYIIIIVIFDKGMFIYSYKLFNEFLKSKKFFKDQ
jgi:O-antigen/teichoic acid export membrane protein